MSREIRTAIWTRAVEANATVAFVKVEWLHEFVIPLVVAIVGGTASALIAAALLARASQGSVAPTKTTSASANQKGLWGRLRGRHGAIAIVVAAALVVGLGGYYLTATSPKGPSTPAPKPSASPVADPDGVDQSIAKAIPGPASREIVSAAARGSRITFNSMMNNPAEGDERRFLRSRTRLLLIAP